MVGGSGRGELQHLLLFLTSQISSGPLHTVADGMNGVYNETLGSFPNQSYLRATITSI
jgi:hypothetical protein